MGSLFVHARIIFSKSRDAWIGSTLQTFASEGKPGRWSEMVEESGRSAGGEIYHLHFLHNHTYIFLRTIALALSRSLQHLTPSSSSPLYEGISQRLTQLPTTTYPQPNPRLSHVTHPIHPPNHPLNYTPPHHPRPRLRVLHQPSTPWCRGSGKVLWG